MQPPQQELGQLPQLAHTMAVPPGHELAQQIGYTPVAQPQQPYEPPQQLSASTTGICSSTATTSSGLEHGS